MRRLRVLPDGQWLLVIVYAVYSLVRARGQVSLPPVRLQEKVWGLGPVGLRPAGDSLVCWLWPPPGGALSEVRFERSLRRCLVRGVSEVPARGQCFDQVAGERGVGDGIVARWLRTRPQDAGPCGDGSADLRALVVG